MGSDQIFQLFVPVAKLDEGASAGKGSGRGLECVW